MTTIRATVKSALVLVWATASFNVLADDQSWVEISDKHSQVVLDSMAKFSPEGAGSLGVDGLDEEIFDLEENIYERGQADNAALLVELQKRLQEEQHPFVRQDLGILIKAVEDNMISSELTRDNMLPYFNVNRNIFQGVRALIDSQVARERYPAAITRMKRYAGLEDGYTPITELAKARSAERFDIEGLQGPYKDEVEQDLERAETFITGLAPGQDTAYYYGYTKMQALRTQTELALREKFNQKAFHDFVLAQRMLPPHLLKSAVFEQFVPSQM